EDFGVIRHQIGGRRVHVQLAEATAKIHLLLDAQLLVAKEYNEVVHERVMHLLELLIVERPGQVDAKNIRADIWGRLAYLDSLVAHNVALGSLCALAIFWV